jgi:CRP-like cAMP-binding protein
MLTLSYETPLEVIRWRAVDRVQSLSGPDNWSALNSAGYTGKREPGQEIIGPKDEPGAVAVLTHGVAIERALFGEAGRVRAVDVLPATDVLGYLDITSDGAWCSTYVASTPVTFSLIPRRDVKGLLDRRPKLQAALAQRGADRRALLQRRFTEASLPDAVRVARLLVDALPLYGRASELPWGKITIDIADLAGLVGLQPEEAAAILGDFATQGLIRWEGASIVLGYMQELRFVAAVNERDMT